MGKPPKASRYPGRPLNQVTNQKNIEFNVGGTARARVPGQPSGAWVGLGDLGDLGKPELTQAYPGVGVCSPGWPKTEREFIEVC